MAAVVQLENREGKKIWRYTVDAKELLAHPDSEWKMTGAVKRSGWATPSGPRQRIGAAAAARKSQAAEVAEAVTAALVQAGVVQPQVAPPTDAELAAQANPTPPAADADVPTPAGFADGLPPEEELDPE